MLKRLIEVALPLKEISEQSASEKNVRHGHISTLHIWWARRPLAACRAAVFASLVPDPDDPQCPESFRQLVRQELSSRMFKPKDGDGRAVEDTPRHRCVEFIKHLVKWENSNDPSCLDPARKLICEGHKILHPESENEVPKLLDPFAGGGAIPLEGLRLGCEAHAVDINPVAHLIELCTLVYPQKFGKPLESDAAVPDYIGRSSGKQSNGNHAANDYPLFGHFGDPVLSESDNIIPDLEIGKRDYLKNPLRSEIEFWSNWVLTRARKQLEKFYPPDPDGSVPIAYLWARTVRCSNPSCRAIVPLIRQLWLSKKPKRRVALRVVPNLTTQRCEFEIREGNGIDYDPEQGTVRQGKAICPFCQTVLSGEVLKEECKKSHLGHHLLAVVTVFPGRTGKNFRLASESDIAAFDRARQVLESYEQCSAPYSVPCEPISKQQPRLMWVTNYGISGFRDLFNDRQLLALMEFVRCACEATSKITEVQSPEFAKVIASYLACIISRMSDFCSSLCRWHPQWTFIPNTFGRQGLPMSWDYAELVPYADVLSGTCKSMTRQVLRAIEGIQTISDTCFVYQASATRLPLRDGHVDIVITDPPYYDAVPYADLSDFFYVWLKRVVGSMYPESFHTLVTPKKEELIEERPHSSLERRKDRDFYEQGMMEAFREMYRVLSDHGVCCVMFAHKTTSAWETIISGLMNSGLLVTGSWPIHTEMKNRMIAQGTASLASSVTLVCRKRPKAVSMGYWDDIRQELRGVTNERLEFFWEQGIRGADFFISAIGPALSIFGKYEKVVRLNGDEVTVAGFLDEVRSLVTGYALEKIIHSRQVASIDAKSQCYVIWKWSYGEAKVEADEAFKFSQALGVESDSLWQRDGILEKSAHTVQLLPISKRMRIARLGEPQADGTAASIIDTLHRMCACRDKSDTVGLAEFLFRSNHAKNQTLWIVAQAISEILPDGDKEKQLLQGLLNQKDNILQRAADAAGLL